MPEGEKMSEGEKIQKCYEYYRQKQIMTSTFDTLIRFPEKRGLGAVVCNCPDVGMLKENILQI